MSPESSAAPEPPAALESAELAARYGRTPAAAKRTRLFVIGTALAFVAVFSAWLVWGGLLGAPAQFETEDTAHTVVSDSVTEVTWRFTVQPGTAASCAVHALNSTFAIVGWVVVDVPPSSERSRLITQTVRTTEKAVTGLIYRCWLT